MAVTSTLVAAALLTSVSCDAPKSVQPVDHASLHIDASTAKGSAKSMDAAGLDKAVHAATARFHSLKQAEKADYVQASECVAIPIGGMGFHYVNEDLVDATFDPLQPEALLYEPDENGKLRLVGVEYVVLNFGQPAPMFGSQPFDVGGVPGLPLDHWSLHVWVHKTNPAGMFAPFNPTVSCPSGGET